jgi:hypothetical protein
MRRRGLLAPAREQAETSRLDAGIPANRKELGCGG